MAWKARLKRFGPWLGLLALAAAVRLPLLFGLGTLWNDEAFSRHFALLPLGDALRYLQMDVHPPLHVVMLHFWIEVFGASALALRASSFVFALLGLAVFLKLGRALCGRREGFLAGFLFAVSPLMAYYGADARMYAMLVFLACLSSLLFWMIVEGEGRGIEAWMWASLALALTHATGALVLAGQALFLLVSSERRRLFRKLFWRYALIALVFAVWLAPAAAFRLSTLSSEWQFRSSQEDLHATLSLLYWVWIGKGTTKLAIAAAVVGLLMLGGVLHRSERKPYFSVSKESAFLFSWFACAFAPFLLFPNVTPRYLVAAVPAFYLLLVRGFLRVAVGRRAGLLLGVALALIIALPGLSAQYAVRPYNWDKAAAWIAERKAEGDRVVFGWHADRLSIENLDDSALAATADGAEGLYPFDDDLDIHARYAAHAGTLAIRPQDLDRLAPAFEGARRVFYVPNFYLTLKDGGLADKAVADWLNARGWFLADRLPPEGRTAGVWLLERK